MIISNLEALAVFEALLRRDPAVTVNDSTRQLAQQQVGVLAEDRIYRGRKVKSTKKDTILLSVTGNLTEMLLSGEDGCTDTFVLVRCLSASDYRASLLNEAVRQLVTAYKGTVTTPAGDVVVGGIFPTDKDSPEPEPPADGSPWFDFEYNLVYRVAHTQTSPSGFN